MVLPKGLRYLCNGMISYSKARLSSINQISSHSCHPTNVIPPQCKGGLWAVKLPFTLKQLHSVQVLIILNLLYGWGSSKCLFIVRRHGTFKQPTKNHNSPPFPYPFPFPAHRIIIQAVLSRMLIRRG